MRELIIPATVTIDHTDYAVDVKFIQDNVISTIYDRYVDEQGHCNISVDFAERAEIRATLDQAKNWVLNQLVTINPFVFEDTQPYIGDTITAECMKQVFNTFNISPVKLASSGDQPATITFLNGTTTSSHLNNTSSYITGSSLNCEYYGGSLLNNIYGFGFSDTDGTNISWQITKAFFPTSSFAGGMFKDTSANFYQMLITFSGQVAVLGSAVSVMVRTINIGIGKVTSSYYKTFTVYGDLLDVPFEDLAAEAQGFSGDNPYEISPSSVGGGYGSGTIRPSDPIPDPEAPNIDAVTTGLLTVFKPSLSQINALGDYLWSSAFDVDSLKKLFGDPMQAIIGLSIVPVNPPAGGSKSVKIGDVDTGITMPYISRQFVEKDLGSITIDPYIGSFMDYSPYTKISIYLPYIGFRELAPEDVMGTTLSIKYIIDVITGGCNAVINVSGKGAIYQFNGSCIANIPLSAINYSGAIQNAVSAIGSGITTVAGIATGNAPVGIMGIAGLASSAANTAVNSKPSIQRAGTMGGAAGLASVQFPYCIIERPRISAPDNYNGFIGNTLNVTMALNDCHGLTFVDQIHLDNVICTEDERNELYTLLKEGVIL